MLRFDPLFKRLCLFCVFLKATSLFQVLLFRFRLSYNVYSLFIILRLLYLSMQSLLLFQLGRSTAEPSKCAPNSQKMHFFQPIFASLNLRKLRLTKSLEKKLEIASNFSRSDLTSTPIHPLYITHATTELQLTLRNIGL